MLNGGQLRSCDFARYGSETGHNNGQDQDSLLVKRRNDNHSPGTVKINKSYFHIAYVMPCVFTSGNFSQALSIHVY